MIQDILNSIDNINQDSQVDELFNIHIEHIIKTWKNKLLPIEKQSIECIHSCERLI
jgi:hypothetical protein